MKQQTLLTKLDHLFAQRQITAYAQQVGLSQHMFQELVGELKALQEDIYQIDELLENNWEIERAHSLLIDQGRKQIEQRVLTITCDAIKTASLLTRLRAFFQMEIQMREGVSPVTIPIDAFYALKICDIHLQRELINVKAKKEFPDYLRHALEQYDKIGEVIDDVEDIDEDIDAINSNRFMLHLYECGLTPTKEAYLAYIDQLAAYIAPQEHEIEKLLGKKALTSSDLAEQAKQLIREVKMPSRTPKLVHLLEAIT